MWGPYRAEKNRTLRAAQRVVLVLAVLGAAALVLTYFNH
jgi:hypothetical protein